VVGYSTIILLQIYCWICGETIFKVCGHLAKLHSRRLIVSHSVHLGIVLLNDQEFAIDFTYDLQKSFINCWYVSKPIDFDSNFSINEYQSDVDHFLLQTPSVTNYNIFFSLMAGAYSQSYCGIFSMTTLCLFISELNNAKITVKIFSTTVLSDWVLHGSFLHSIVEHGNFLNISMLQGSVATCLRCGGIFNKWSK